MKGQKSRSGVAINAFEGGQMPLFRRLPKRGFVNIFAKTYNVISLGRIQQAIDAGRLDASNEINIGALVASGLLRRPKDGVRVLGDGELTTAVKLNVAGASKSAVEKVEKAGGSITTG